MGCEAPPWAPASPRHPSDPPPTAAPGEVLEAVEGADRSGRPELGDLLRRAFRDRGYLIVFTAFFTCGFHMAIIETQLVSQMQHDGMTPAGAAEAFAVYGVAAMVGPVIAGWLCGHLPMRVVLAATYGSRAVIVAVFRVRIRGALAGQRGRARIPIGGRRSGRRSHGP